MTVDQILETLGGFSNVAKETGIPLTTVHSWKRVGFIPEWRRPALLAMAKGCKAHLSEADFPDRPESAAA